MLTQLGLAVLLERGALDRHIRSSRLVYRRRRDALIAALERDLPELRPRRGRRAAPARRPAARLDEGAVVAAAPARGVGLDGLAPTPPAPTPGLILGYGRISEPAIEPGVRALARRSRP